MCVCVLVIYRYNVNLSVLTLLLQFICVFMVIPKFEQVIHDPIVLFLDEPTSGLDSTSAFVVVKVLQRIAKSGSVVVMAIHQPSLRIVDVVDRMILLSKGEVVFSGEPMEIVGFFNEFGCQIPVNENQVEFALDLIHEFEGEMVCVAINL